MPDMKIEMERIRREPLPRRTAADIQERVSGLMARMTLPEKIGQMFQTTHWSGIVTGPEYDTHQTLEKVRKGKIGSFQGLTDNQVIYQLQKIAVEETRLGIPLLFCLDIIHGCRTTFPTNLAMSCSWNPELVRKSISVVAAESAHSGVNLTFSPMLDLVRDPRWGRVMESNGEDACLSSAFAEAYVRGYQQDNLSGYDTVACCAKHYVGYGAVEAGREYNAVDLSERVLRNHYLPPFAAAIKAGVKMVMTSFNTLFDIPVTANEPVLRGMLRGDLKFRGVTVSDYSSSAEIKCHKIATDDETVAVKCLKAGLDVEMMSNSYINHLEAAVAKGRIPATLIEEACARILTLKYELGLFDNPYKNIYADPEQNFQNSKYRVQAFETACESAVLLKNDAVLPLGTDRKIALIGPFSDSKDVIGAWGGKADWNATVTLKEAFEDAGLPFIHERGSNVYDGLDATAATRAAAAADIVVLAVGEPGNLSGEAASRTCLDLPGVQNELFTAVLAAKKPVVVVIFSGRPLTIGDWIEKTQATLWAWQLGTESGHALCALLTGARNPSGKLTMTFPRSVGQIPLYYNFLPTGRPYMPENPTEMFRTHYVDLPNEPLFPFGFGRGYSPFVYGAMKTDKEILKPGDAVTVSVDVFNAGTYDGAETVQLYIEAECFSVARPVNELKKFAKRKIKAGHSETFTFSLDSDDFAFWNADMVFISEPGRYQIKVGPSSAELQMTVIVLSLTT